MKPRIIDTIGLLKQNVLEWNSSGSDQKSLFDHDRLIGLQKLIFRCDLRFLMLHDRSFHLPTIDFSFFFFVNNEKRPISWY